MQRPALASFVILLLALSLTEVSFNLFINVECSWLKPDTVRNAEIILNVVGFNLTLFVTLSVAVKF